MNYKDAVRDLRANRKWLLQDLHREPHPESGLCYMSSAPEVLRGLMTHWPKYSGAYCYPVPHPTEDPQNAYYKAQAEGTLWDKATPYGQARHELRAWLINTLENLQ